MTNTGERRTLGNLNATCQFPFIVKGKIYHTCTWDYSYATGNNPWCSTETDDNNEHRKGSAKINGKKKKFVGICDDYDACPIPPRRKFEYYQSYVKYGELVN